MTPSVRQAPTRKTRRYLWLAVAILVVIGLSAGTLVVGAIAFSNAGTSLTRKDFATEASARAFVSEHLPVELPANVTVRTLTYDHFTDFRLEAHLAFSDDASLSTYLARVRAARQLDTSYCGTGPLDDGGATESVQYFLPKVSACGYVEREPNPNVARVECNTR